MRLRLLQGLLRFLSEFVQSEHSLPPNKNRAGGCPALATLGGACLPRYLRLLTLMQVLTLLTSILIWRGLAASFLGR